MNQNKKIELLNEVIRTRRSVFPAQYIDREIEDQVLNEILENAHWAPTHKLTEPWRFKVLKGEAKARLADFMANRYREENSGDKFLEKKYLKLQSNPRKAAAIILICMQRDHEERVPEWEELASVAAAVQNMWLTCHAYGIGSYWSSPSFIHQMNEFIKLAEGEKCLGIFYLGYYEEIPPIPKRKGADKNIQWIIE